MDRLRPLWSIGYLASEHVLFQGEMRVAQSTLWLIAVLLAAMALIPSVKGAFPGEQEGPNDVPPMSRVSPSDSPEPGGLPPSATPSAVVGVGTDLTDLVMDPNRPYVYTADRLRDQVLVVSLATASVERTLPVGDQPVALALNPSATMLYVGHAGERTIRAFDLASWTQVENLTVPFLTWDLAAPTETELVATTHDSGFAGEYPYVISATNGSVLQRLNPGELVYMDFLVALNSARTWAYLVPSAAAPFLMYSFERDPQGIWTFRGRGPDFGSGTPAARDIAVAPDGRWIYVTLAGGTLEGIAADRTGSGPVGLGSTSYAADVGPTSQFVASGGAAEVRIYDVSAASDPGGFNGFPADPEAGLGLTGHAWALRSSPSGDRIAIVIGPTDNAGQALEIVNVPPLTRVRPIDPAERFSRQSVFDIVGRIIDFRTMTDLSATVSLNGMSTPASFDSATGLVVAHVGPLAEGDYATEIRAFRGTLVAIAVWTFTVDTTPPDLHMDPVPTVVESDVLNVSGTVVDPHLSWVRVGSIYATPAPGGRFVLTVLLLTGTNTIEVEAADQAGNVALAGVTTEFPPTIRLFSHAIGHFPIQIPFGWSAAGDLTQGRTRFDVLLSGTDPALIVGVSSDTLATVGDSRPGRILDGIIAQASSTAGVIVFEPVADRVVDEHPAARAVIAVTVVGNPQVFEIVTVVVGAEWGRYWVIIGAATIQVFDSSRGQIEAAMATFDVLEATGSPVSNFLQAYQGWLLLTAIGATVAEAAILGFLMLRTSRRKP